MIDPLKISNFNLSEPELEEVALFWICAAGKRGTVMARQLDALLASMRLYGGMNRTPFELIRYLHEAYKQQPNWLYDMMKSNGIGCWTTKAAAFIELAHSRLDLRTCSHIELEKIKGIGPKTSRAFIVHSRPNQKFAVIDTHLLKFLRHQGVENVPDSTPTQKRYGELEKAFLKICRKNHVDASELDLAIWNHYRVFPSIPFDIEKWKASK